MYMIESDTYYEVVITVENTTDVVLFLVAFFTLSISCALITVILMMLCYLAAYYIDELRYKYIQWKKRKDIDRYYYYDDDYNYYDIP